MGIHKYKINETFFESIDSEIKAYWLGFIFADGSVRQKDKNSYTLTISQSDKSVLQDFLTDVESNHKIGEYKVSNGYKIGSVYYLITIHSKKIFEDLCKLGCVPNKSLKLKFPKINKELISHFIRGYFDGDGCVCISKSTRNYFSFSTVSYYLLINITGTKEFLEGIKENLPFINSKNNIIHKEKRRSTNSYRLDLTSTKRSMLFMNYLYKDASRYFQKKRKTFRDYNENYYKKVDRIVRPV